MTTRHRFMVGLDPYGIGKTARRKKISYKKAHEFIENQIVDFMEQDLGFRYFKFIENSLLEDFHAFKTFKSWNHVKKECMMIWKKFEKKNWINQISISRKIVNGKIQNG